MTDNTPELVERLRGYHNFSTTERGEVITSEAADTIESLQAKHEGLLQWAEGAKLDNEALQARVKELETVIERLGDGTWWDGNEPYSVERMESFAKAYRREPPE